MHSDREIATKSTQPSAILRIAATVGALLVVAACKPQVGDEPQMLAIVNVTLVDTEAGTTIPDMTVVIQHGRILGVADSPLSLPDDVEVIQGHNEFLMPGLWDMHVHLSYARPSALPALVANGVTGVRDVGSDLDELDAWRTQIADELLVGPTIVRGGPMINGEEYNEYQLGVADGLEGRMAVRRLQKAGVDFIKIHRRTSREAFFAIADETRQLGLPFVGHVPMSVSPREASEAGQDSIEHTVTLFEGTFAADHEGQDVAREISRWRETEATALFATFVRNGTMVDPTLIAQEYVARLLASAEPDPRERYIARSAREEAERTLEAVSREAFLTERRPVLRELRAVTGLMSSSGVKLLTGTDLSFLHPPGFSLHEELALLVQSGVPVAEVLRAATIHPGGLFRWQDSGRIAVGMRADLVLLDANPFDDIKNTQRIRAVVLRGKYLDRQALDQLLSQAEQLAESN